MSKRPPELTWQDKAILVVIPLIVFAIFIAANYISKDLTVSEAFQKKMTKTMIRDSGNIIELLPKDETASGTQLCKLRSREGGPDFIFKYHIEAGQTMDLQIGQLVQFFGEYHHDAKGGYVEVPFKGKSGQLTGWAVYKNKRYFSTSGEEPGNF